MSDTVQQGRAYVQKMRERGKTDAEIEQAPLGHGLGRRRPRYLAGGRAG